MEGMPMSMNGADRGKGWMNSKRGGRGRMAGNRRRLGPGGKCICPVCGATIAHTPGMPCSQRICPNCGARMRRE